MFFKKLRARRKSTAQSSKPSMKSSSTNIGTLETKVPDVIVTAPTDPKATAKASSRNSKRDAKEPEEEVDDYQAFLEKERKNIERLEKKKLREIQQGREMNMSPWAGRM